MPRHVSGGCSFDGTGCTEQGRGDRGAGNCDGVASAPTTASMRAARVGNEEVEPRAEAMTNPIPARRPRSTPRSCEARWRSLVGRVGMLIDAERRLGRCKRIEPGWTSGLTEVAHLHADVTNDAGHRWAMMPGAPSLPFGVVWSRTLYCVVRMCLGARCPQDAAISPTARSGCPWPFNAYGSRPRSAGPWA